MRSASGWSGMESSLAPFWRYSLESFTGSTAGEPVNKTTETLGVDRRPSYNALGCQG